MSTTLEIHKLTKRYRRVPVVNDVSFSINSGEITGYLGPNGSGKSTTVKMLTGLVEPSSGQILLNGIDVRRDFIGFKRREAARSDFCGIASRSRHSYFR